MPQPKIFLGDGMQPLQELIAARFPGAVLEFSWAPGYNGGNADGMHFRDMGGNRFDALGSFTIVSDGKKMAVAQLFINFKTF